ncbi:STAM-binding protein-like [Littorina saxatilis]|uniref:MPN domain-containing protein n=1 Tax=Littorina saxatilis TaxID=31220 RepID=A0AAN9BVH6_9CAEN
MAGSSLANIHDPTKKVRALADYGSQVEVDKTISPKLYFRSGREMLRMANMYCDEGNMESAFILYSKFITLFVEKLPSHPDFKSSPPNDVQDFKRKVKKVFPLAEEIKSQLKKKYIEEEQKWQAEEQKRQEQLAREEEQQRKEKEEQIKKDEEMARQMQTEAEERWMKEQENKYKHLQQQEAERIAAEKRRKEEEEASSSMGAGVMLIPADISGVVSDTGGDLPSAPTPAPRTVVPGTADQSVSPVPRIPDRELKKHLSITDQGPEDVPSLPPPAYSPPIPDRSTKPADHFMSTGPFDGSGGIRDVVVPVELMEKFVKVSHGSTLKNVETMGILCGKVAGAAFKITHLFIPNQSGTPDSCDMKNEEELIFYQDKYDLITFGWIHTHPTQTAFLSSVDMHTHFAYQKMLPEAIAIVCSPKYQETGVFSLSDLGLEVIGNCREKGFHYHSKEPPLFVSSSHARTVTSESITLTDMRK